MVALAVDNTFWGTNRSARAHFSLASTFHLHEISLFTSRGRNQSVLLEFNATLYRSFGYTQQHQWTSSPQLAMLLLDSLGLATLNLHCNLLSTTWGYMLHISQYSWAIILFAWFNTESSANYFAMVSEKMQSWCDENQFACWFCCDFSGSNQLCVFLYTA